MSFILVTLLFTGNTELQYFKDNAYSQDALEQTVDLGNYKHIDIKCTMVQIEKLL